jgi:hypothetical protein
LNGCTDVSHAFVSSGCCEKIIVADAMLSRDTVGVWALHKPVQSPAVGMQGEYTGEVLEQQEAERRGQVYDQIDCSYLFQVNEDWALDGRKVGSLLRYGCFFPTFAASMRRSALKSSNQQP